MIRRLAMLVVGAACLASQAYGSELPVYSDYEWNPGLQTHADGPEQVPIFVVSPRWFFRGNELRTWRDARLWLHTDENSGVKAPIRWARVTHWTSAAAFMAGAPLVTVGVLGVATQRPQVGTWVPCRGPCQTTWNWQLPFPWGKGKLKQGLIAPPAEPHGAPTMIVSPSMETERPKLSPAAASLAVNFAS